MGLPDTAAFSKHGDAMKIGELSRQTGCPVATLRFYEKEGLLPKEEK